MLRAGAGTSRPRPQAAGGLGRLEQGKDFMGEQTHDTVSSMPGLVDELVSITSETAILVEGLVMDATRALFETYGVKLELDGRAITKTLPSVDLISTIGFSSPNLNGSLLLAIPNVVLQQTLPTPGADLADWSGELANQLLGRLKNKLTHYEVLINLALPVVVSGDEFHLRAMPHCLTRHFSFISEWGRMFVRTEMELCPSLELERQDLGNTSVGMDEGELLFF
jgi:hypothetical protein